MMATILAGIYKTGLLILSGNQYDQMGDDNWCQRRCTVGDYWAMHYYGMGQNLNRVIEWGTEEKKWDYVGVALCNPCMELVERY